MSGLTQCYSARRNCVGMQALQTVRLWMLHAPRFPHYFRPHAPASAPPPAQPSYCSDLPMTPHCWVLSVTVTCRRGTSPCISECNPSVNHTRRKRWVKYAVDSKSDWTVKTSNNSALVPCSLNETQLFHYTLLVAHSQRLVISNFCSWMQYMQTGRLTLASGFILDTSTHSDSYQ